MKVASANTHHPHYIQWSRTPTPSVLFDGAESASEVLRQEKSPSQLLYPMGPMLDSHAESPMQPRTETSPVFPKHEKAPSQASSAMVSASVCRRRASSLEWIQLANTSP